VPVRGLRLRGEVRWGKLVTKCSARDAEGLWADDAVEVFVKPPAGGEYLHWVANSAGVVFDERCASQEQRETGWNSGVIARGQQQGRSWQLEMAVPWADIPGGRPKVGMFCASA